MAESGPDTRGGRASEAGIMRMADSSQGHDPLDSVLECFGEPVLASRRADGQNRFFSSCNSAAQRIFGYSPDQFRQMALADLAGKGDHADYPLHASPDGTPSEWEVRVSPQAGQALHMKLSQFCASIGGENLILHAFSARSESTSDALDGSTAALVFNRCSAGMAICDRQGVIINANQAFCAQLGQPAGELNGRGIPHLLSPGSPPGFWESVCQEVDHHSSWDGRLRVNGCEGLPAVFSASARPLYDQKGRHGLLLLEIRRELDEEEKRLHLQSLSHRDHLTGLPNRALFNDRLKIAAALARRRGTGLAILFLDLDNFKTINDSLGHTLGDKLLRRVGERLMECVRDEDTVSRLGGDEFLVVLQDISSVEEAGDASRRILSAVSAPMYIDRHELYVSASVGITIFPDDGEDAETLVRNADMAMFAAKEQGKNNFQHYTPSLNTRVNRRLLMENSLRKGFQRREFLVHYQPQVDFQTGKVVGMEALARWKRADLGLVGAHEFIPLAEETGLIVPIGEYVLYQSCHFAQQCHRAGHPDMTVSVNFSARQLLWQHDAVDMLEGVMRELDFDPTRLELEITESAVMHNVEGAIEAMSRIRDMGVRLALDDFGTGYSSLHYLKRFPINTLKVDRSFVKDVPGDPDDVAIILGVISMAKSLNLRVVAEGVETEEQFNFLREQGCSTMQGFLFSPAVDPEDFLDLVNSGKSLA